MTSLYHKLLQKLAHFQVNRPYISVLLLFFLTLAIYGGVSSVRTVASLEQMMPKDISEIKAFHVLRDNYLGQDMIAIVLTVDENYQSDTGVIDIRDKRVYDYLNSIKTILQDETDIISIYSYADLIRTENNQIISSKENNQIMSSEENNQIISLEEYNNAIYDPKLKSQIQNYINGDYSTTIILITTDVSADDPRMNLLSDSINEKIKNAKSPPGTLIKLTGTPIIQQKLGELIAKDRSETKWISTLFVFLIIMFIFRSLTSALVPITIVTISVTWLYGTMGYFDLPISTLAGGVAAMVIGIGIDFAIHIINKFKYERKKGLSIKDSIECAVVETGTALTATSVTTIAAFLAFLIGRMPEMGRFGILMAIGITYSLLFSLFGLPALLVIEEKMIYYLKKKLRFGIEGELILTSAKNGGDEQ